MSKVKNKRVLLLLYHQGVSGDADTDFILTENIPDLTNYKAAGDIISCRIYQDNT